MLVMIFTSFWRLSYVMEEIYGKVIKTIPIAKLIPIHQNSIISICIIYIYTYICVCVYTIEQHLQT